MRVTKSYVVDTKKCSSWCYVKRKIRNRQKYARAYVSRQTIVHNIIIEKLLPAFFVCGEVLRLCVMWKCARVLWCLVGCCDFSADCFRLETSRIVHTHGCRMLNVYSYCNVVLCVPHVRCSDGMCSGVLALIGFYAKRSEPQPICRYGRNSGEGGANWMAMLWQQTCVTHICA